MTYKLTNSLSLYISIALLIGISACVSAAKGPFFQEANGTNPAKGRQSTFTHNTYPAWEF